ncbi:hypothetical protein BT96DRAFT_1007116 [Gymnopus androsaceus JB14]|uniref:Uncharacterized protein n=1 Tax=Gymnopus androsaceus JB14 TaxID=1447944 RepID=A0A6A4GJ19_9AGAR|nr:hypothetical protein BT96DRAFT_1007116 [Gymnopus androsaceus JB14]
MSAKPKPKHTRKSADDGGQPSEVKRVKRARKAKEKGNEEKLNEKEDQKNIEWTSKLAFTLIACIAKDKDIKNGLYPGPGANISTAKGGGLPKTEHQFKLFTMIFGDHPEWQPAIELAQTPQKKGPASKTRTNFGLTIKRMAKQTRE